MDRRTFLNWFGVGTIAGSLPWAIAACSPQTTTSTTTSNSEFKAAGTLAQLDQTGQLLVKEGLTNPALIIRDPADSQKLIAVNPTCTHNGCTVEWKTDAGEFVCPCHAARFKTDGTVAQGPATNPIPVYEVKVEGDQVLVKAG